MEVRITTPNSIIHVGAQNAMEYTFVTDTGFKNENACFKGMSPEIEFMEMLGQLLVKQQWGTHSTIGVTNQGADLLVHEVHLLSQFHWRLHSQWIGSTGLASQEGFFDIETGQFQVRGTVVWYDDYPVKELDYLELRWSFVDQCAPTQRVELLLLSGLVFHLLTHHPSKSRPIGCARFDQGSVFVSRWA